MTVEEYLAIFAAINVAKSATQRELNTLNNTVGENGLLKDYYKGFLETLEDASKSLVVLYKNQ